MIATASEAPRPALLSRQEAKISERCVGCKCLEHVLGARVRLELQLGVDCAAAETACRFACVRVWRGSKKANKTGSVWRAMCWLQAPSQVRALLRGRCRCLQWLRVMLEWNRRAAVVFGSLLRSNSDSVAFILSACASAAASGVPMRLSAWCCSCLWMLD